MSDEELESAGDEEMDVVDEDASIDDDSDNRLASAVHS